MMRKFCTLLVLQILAMTAPPGAQAHDLSQLSEKDLSSVIRFVLPSALRQLQTTCGPHLDSDSYIYANSEALSARFATAAQGTGPQAMTVFAQLAAEGDPQVAQLLAQMPPEVVQPFVSEIVAGILAQEITPESCLPANRILELLDPLPVENSADLIGFVMRYVADTQTSEARRTDG